MWSWPLDLLSFGAVARCSYAGCVRVLDRIPMKFGTLLCFLTGRDSFSKRTRLSLVIYMGQQPSANVIAEDVP